MAHYARLLQLFALIIVACQLEYYVHLVLLVQLVHLVQYSCHLSLPDVLLLVVLVLV